MADTQCWATNADGGYLTNNRLSRQLRFALTPLMKFRQFCDLKEAWGLGKGSLLFWDKISRINTSGYTHGTLAELTEMPANKFTIGRGTLAVHEYGNSIPFTGKLEALSEFNINNPIQRTLRDDMGITLDHLAGYQFKMTKLKYIASSTVAGGFETLASDSTKTIGSSRNAKGGWRLYHIDEVVSHLKSQNVPPYDDAGNYICIASVNFLKQIKKDSDWKNAARYGDPERIFAGEVGRISGCRFIEESNVLVNTIGTGGDFGEAVIFGKEAVVEGIAVPEELRAKIPTDYGRSKGIAWYTIAGWIKAWKITDTNQYEHIVQLTGKS